MLATDCGIPYNPKVFQVIAEVPGIIHARAQSEHGSGVYRREVMMKGMRRMLASVAVTAALLMAAGGAISARAQDPGGAKQPYTPAEYNAYVACTQEKAAQARVRCLEDFAIKYPNPNLLIYAYPAARDISS
jgi:hypothetical protein